MEFGLHRTDRGALLTETLIVLAVIGLLAGSAIPVYHGRASEAKVNRARVEVEALARAETEVARVHAFYVPLQMLDNIPVDPSTRTHGRTDDLQNEANVFLIDPHENPLDQRNSGQLRLLSGRITDLRVRDLYEQWEGPFYQSKRVHGSEDRSHDYPLDPWRNPYRFYSPAGLIGSLAAEDGADAMESDEFADGRLTNEDDRFESFAIVSFGPDGQSDSVSKNDDDVIYLFE